MTIRSDVIEAVESLRAEALDLLQTLVRTPSLEGDEKACQEIVEHRLKEMGLEVDRWAPSDAELEAHSAYVPTGMSYSDRPNVVGTLKGSGAGRSLITSRRKRNSSAGRPRPWVSR